MKHLVRSFRTHLGMRGVHFYDSESCNFLDWADVIKFLKAVPSIDKDHQFSERLLETMANYDPDNQFLAVQQGEGTVSVELYTDAAIADSRLYG
jgi:hypothetical protein